MEPKKSIGFQLKRIDNLILRYLHTKIAEAGFDEVTTMHGYILGYLYCNSQNVVYQRDIEKNFGITKSTVTSILKLMEKKGYLIRESCIMDGRLKKISLTDLGIKTHLEIIEIINEVHKEVEEGISPKERETFEKILHKMEENINKINDRRRKDAQDIIAIY